MTVLSSGLLACVFLAPAGCEEQQDSSLAQQARPVKSEPVQAKAMYTCTPVETPPRTDIWGRPIDPVARAVNREPNFWDMSTWRLDFWNPAPGSPDPETMATNNKSLDKLLDLNRRQQEHMKKYGTNPPPTPSSNSTNQNPH